MDFTVSRAMCALAAYAGLVRVLSGLGTPKDEGVKGESPALNALRVVSALLGFPIQVHFSAKFLHSVDHLSYYVCATALGHNNVKVQKEHPPR